MDTENELNGWTASWCLPFHKHSCCFHLSILEHAVPFTHGMPCLPFLLKKKHLFIDCVGPQLLLSGPSPRYARCLVWSMDSLVAALRLSCSSACGILVLWPGIKPKFPALQGAFLTTRPPVKSPSHWYYDANPCFSLMPLLSEGPRPCSWAQNWWALCPTPAPSGSPAWNCGQVSLAPLGDAEFHLSSWKRYIIFSQVPTIS